MRERPSKKRTVYHGRVIDVSSDTVIIPGGKKAVREYIRHPGAVAVLAFPDPKRILLVRQYRYPVGTATWEIPAGKMDRGEDPAACVRRELEEETGYRAERVRKLLSFWPTPAFSDEVLHIFRADSLRKTAPSPDEDEFLQVRILEFRKALEWVKKGRIRDSKTVIALLSKGIF